jgi:hypothetical protein
VKGGRIGAPKKKKKKKKTRLKSRGCEDWSESGKLKDQDDQQRFAVCVNNSEVYMGNELNLEVGLNVKTANVFFFANHLTR